MSTTHGAFEVLDRARCADLLAPGGVGRVVFTRHALPTVRPVRFVVRDDVIWFRVPDSDVWLAGALGTVVAFAVDDVRAGWFLTVVGTAREVRDGRLVEDMAAVLPPTNDAADYRYVRLPVESVSGRLMTPCADGSD